RSRGTHIHGVAHWQRVIPARGGRRHNGQRMTSNPTAPLKSSTVDARPGGATHRSPLTRTFTWYVPAGSANAVSHTSSFVSRSATGFHPLKSPEISTVRASGTRIVM